MKKYIAIFFFSLTIVGEQQKPNDPLFEKQWALTKLQVPKAWEIAKGSKKIAIAIIGTGIDYNHPDLKDNMWINPHEIPGNNIDDDNNSYIDDIHGINAIERSGDPMDDNEDGTIAAGIIGAKVNNGIGIAGVMPEVSLIACKFLDKTGSGITTDAIRCLDYVTELVRRDDLGVKIIATINPWGGGSFSQDLHDAIRIHETLGILFVAGAGNGGSSIEDYSVYPASYKLSNVLVTAKIDEEGRLATFSSYGPNSVHVAMPGVNIWTTFPNNNYEAVSGTAATAFLGGIIGLTKSAHPTFTAQEIKEKVLNSIDLFSSLEDQAKIITGGYVNAFKCVSP